MAEATVSVPSVIRAPRTDPIYNCHSYLTKVPIGAITPFIEHFSSVGELVADPFAGSGMTGIAAATLGRRAMLSDISILGRHIAQGYLSEVEPEAYREQAAKVARKARESIGNIYETIRLSDGIPSEMMRTVWSFTYLCPECSDELVYYKRIDLKRPRPPESCLNCCCAFARRSWPRAADVPVQVVVRNQAGRLTEQSVQDVDRRRISAAENDGRLQEVPSQEISRDREMFSRSGLGPSGLTQTGLFFSARNAIALLELWNAIGGVDNDRVRHKLRFAFTAILPRASRRYQWGPKRPLNAQNQTYYVAPIYYEWNVFDLFIRKVEAVIRSDNKIFRSAPLFASDPASDIQYNIASADSLDHLEPDSVDYVFTDPPFGSNIFYSDMSLFQEAWLGTVTDSEHEAVMHTTGKRKSQAAERYEVLLRGAFAEAYRVLKPGRYMSVVFGNSNGAIWALVQRALRSAGFGSPPIHVAILDKGQRSVKGLNSGSEGVVTVDLVLTVQKPGDGLPSVPVSDVVQTNASELLDDAIAGLEEDNAMNPSYVYAAVVREAVKRHLLVDNLHLSDVLIALRNAGFSVDRKSGLLKKPVPTTISPTNDSS